MENGLYRRMPEDVAKSVSQGVFDNSCCSAGGRIRFVTDSPYVIIRVSSRTTVVAHQALTGHAGFDLYTTSDGDTRYGGTFILPVEDESNYDSIVELTDPKKQVITINMPLFANVSSVMIGLPDGCILEEAPDYTYKKPIVYYGSSITHGGCASRAGTSYTSIVSRRLDADYISLGFNGSAKGELEMAYYINSLDMGVLVLDYDHNSGLAQLTERHEAFFLEFRKHCPDTPVVMVSAADKTLGKPARRDIIRKTYENALAAGDQHVYFVDGTQIYKVPGVDACTVDNAHPNDLGFWCMANAIEKPLRECL